MAPHYDLALSLALLALLTPHVSAIGIRSMGSTNAALAIRGGDAHLGGACGFRSPFPPTSIYVAGLSQRLLNIRDSCGKCFELSCTNSRFCNKGAKVVVTVVNECGYGKNKSSLCRNGAFNLQSEAFDVISHNPNIGYVSALYKPVPCKYRGGVQVSVLVGSNQYLQVLVQNVAGAGNLKLVEVSPGGAPYAKLTHSFGSVFQTWGVPIAGKALSFRITASDGTKRVLPNVVPANFVAAKIYSSKINL